MKRQKLQNRFSSILPVIIMVICLLAGSSAQLSLPPSAQATHDQKPASGASDKTQSNQACAEISSLKNAARDARQTSACR